ncbi:MAG: peptidylprolyl isomerase [Candidatus Micrarchaeia archaeon]
MLKKGDFVKLEYTGYDKNGNIFDSTSGEISKTIRNREGPILIVYGYGQTIAGIEEKIKDLEPEKEVYIEIPLEKAFGKRKKELMKIMKEEEFKRYEIIPKPGITVHVDFENKRMYGLIKSVNSGRVLVDFNHPFAGQNLKYKIKLVEIIQNPHEKIEALILESGLDCDFKLNDGILEISYKHSKEENSEKLRLLNTIKGLISEVKEIRVN